MATRGVLCMWRVCVWCALVLVLLEGAGAQERASVSSICDLKGCNCSSTAHSKFDAVNCTFDDKQTIDLYEGMISNNVMELFLIGGAKITFYKELFTKATGFHILRIFGTKHVIFKTHSFLNLVSNSLIMEIISCRKLHFEERSFKYDNKIMKTSISTLVSKCGEVIVESFVFSYLQDATFEDISKVILMNNSFSLDKIILENKHGPFVRIYFRKVKIPSIPKDAFKSPLAQVAFHNCEIGEVMPEAFNGITISDITFNHTSILGSIHRQAFSSRMQVENLRISNCRINVTESEAIKSALTNLVIEHSSINTVKTKAISSTADQPIIQAEIRHNEIKIIHPIGFNFNEWNCIYIENNLFDHLHTNSMVLNPSSALQSKFTFINNEMIIVDNDSLKFITLIENNTKTTSRFDTNYFKNDCHCDIKKWLNEILGSNSQSFFEDNYCTVNSVISECFDIPEGLVLMQNFTDHHCLNGNNKLRCKTFTADQLGVNNKFGDSSDNMILGLVLGLVLLVAVTGTIVILLIHGGLWLKRKGYCVRFNNNFQYRVEEGSTETEDIMVVSDKDKENLPEELTQDLLQTLREKLENPLTHNEAREMIERLYDHFIVEDSYTNNNRQEEETHLYEELGSMPQGNLDLDKNPTRPFSFLRLIEERFNLTPTVSADTKGSVLVGEYSEPTDAEVHLYSELPQNLKEGKQNEINESLTHTDPTATQRSNGSGKMAYRPLPDKPPPLLDPGEGPSTKF